MYNKDLVASSLLGFRQLSLLDYTGSFFLSLVSDKRNPIISK